MSITKRIIALLLISVIALSVLSGCTGNGVVDPTSAPETKAPVTEAPENTAAPTAEAITDLTKYVAAKPKETGDLTNRERYECSEKAGDVSRLTEKLWYALLDESEDLAFSPVNIYIALAMLAETADGDTRAEILEALGVSGDALLTQAENLIKAETFDNERGMCKMANSIWLNNSFGFNTDTLERLANGLGASSFWGDPADRGFTLALRDWLNENTGNLLKDSVDSLELDPETVAALVSTIWLKGNWDSRFTESATSTDTFRGAKGNAECSFMHKTTMGDGYHLGDNFTAVFDNFQGYGGVWYLLPNDGVSIEDMLKNGGMDFILDRGDDDVQYNSIVRYTVPKYDICADLDLIDTLKALGMKACFDPNSADFSPLTDEDGLYVSEIKHSARIKADEEGVEAAAYTEVMIAAGAMAPTDLVEIDLTLDRPFVLVITGFTGQPLFVGVVNNVG